VTGPTGPTGAAGQNGVSGGLVLIMDTAGGAAPQTGTLELTATTTAQTTITSGNQTNTTGLLMGTFVSAVGVITSPLIAAGIWDIVLHAVAVNNGVSFYGDFYYVDSDGTSNPVLIADISCESNACG
jgi:hypothetical protein